MSAIIGKKCDICNKLYAFKGKIVGHQMDVTEIKVKVWDDENADHEYKDICPNCSMNLSTILRNLLAQRVRSELDVRDDE